jgi:hypothetical protein
MSPYDIEDDFGGGLYPSGGMYGGMYGLTEEDKRKARNMGLMSAGLGILAANQPSPHPKSALGVLGQGGLQGLNAYQGDLRGRMGEKSMASGMALRDAQMGELKRNAERRDAAVTSLQGLSEADRKDPAKLYNLALQHNAAGNTQLGSTFLSMANHLDSQNNRQSQSSQMERGLGVIRRLYMKDAANPGSLTPDERAELGDAVSIARQVRTAFDPTTGRMETFNPLEISEQYNPMLERYGHGLKKRPDIFRDDVPGRKPLDQASEKELQGFNDAGKQLFDLTKSLEPNYGGFKLDTAAQVALTAGRRLSPETLKKMGMGGMEKQAQWWQNYYNWANDIRAAKFGLTLTGNELEAFERSTPKPSDGNAQIEAALNAQLKILNDKQRNRKEGLVAGKYNPEQVATTAGPERSVQPDEESAIAAIKDASGRGQIANALVKKKPKPKMLMKGQIVDGYRWNGGDPKKQESWEKVQ